EVSKKSLRVLDKKLQDLKAYGTFDVNINSVVGGGIKNPEDARTINNRARDLGFSTSIGIIHDGSGHLKPLGGAERKVYDEVSAALLFRFLGLLGLLLLLRVLLATVGVGPILLELGNHLLHDAPVVGDDSNFTPLLELETSETLAAYISSPAVAHDGSDVKPPSGKFLAFYFPLRLDLPDDPHVDAGIESLLDEPKHRIVADVRIVDEEL